MTSTGRNPDPRRQAKRAKAEVEQWPKWMQEIAKGGRTVGERQWIIREHQDGSHSVEGPALRPGTDYVTVIETLPPSDEPTPPEPEGRSQEAERCPQCAGLGFNEAEEDCPRCKGTGVEPPSEARSDQEREPYDGWPNDNDESDIADNEPKQQDVAGSEAGEARKLIQEKRACYHCGTDTLAPEGACEPLCEDCDPEWTPFDPTPSEAGPFVRCGNCETPLDDEGDCPKCHPAPEPVAHPDDCEGCAEGVFDHPHPDDVSKPQEGEPRLSSSDIPSTRLSICLNCGLVDGGPCPTCGSEVVHEWIEASAYDHLRERLTHWQSEFRIQQEKRLEAEANGAMLFEVGAVLDDLAPDTRDENAADWLRRELRAREARAERAEQERDNLQAQLDERQPVSAVGRDHVRSAWERSKRYAQELEADLDRAASQAQHYREVLQRIANHRQCDMPHCGWPEEWAASALTEVSDEGEGQ